MYYYYSEAIYVYTIINIIYSKSVATITLLIYYQIYLKNIHWVNDNFNNFH